MGLRTLSRIKGTLREEGLSVVVTNTKGPLFEGPWLVAGAGFEPATFGL
jgi:hypothetical protein